MTDRENGSQRPQDYRKGPVTLRRALVPAHDDRPAAARHRRARPTGCTTDPWRVLRIQAEFVEGFGALAELGPAISVFGSARTEPDHPDYAVAERLGAAARAGGFAVITGGGPGAMEAANKGACEAGGVSVGLGIELPFEQGINEWVDLAVQLPLLLRPQDDVRQVRAGLRRAARRLRHPRRALRGARPGADPQGHRVPHRALGTASGAGCSTGSAARSPRGG